MDPFNDDIMYVAGGRSIWREDSLSAIPMTGDEYNTTLQGWTRLAGTSLGTSFLAPHYSTLDISEANPNILYLGTDDGHVYRLDSCRTNNAALKVNVTGSNFPVGAYVSCVEVDRLNPNNVLVTFSNYGVVSIFYTNDAGTTWTDVSGNLEDNPDGSGNGPSVTWGHIYDDGTSVKYFVGTSIGLFSTDNLNGLNTVWQQEGANTIGNVVINMITSRTSDNTIVVATHGNGIYSNKIFTPSAITTVGSESLKVACYPNPFNNSVTIDFGTLTTGEAKAEVFDLEGRLVNRISGKNVSKLIWNGKTEENNVCTPGTYFIKINEGNKGVMKKVVKL